MSCRSDCKVPCLPWEDGPCYIPGCRAACEALKDAKDDAEDLYDDVADAGAAAGDWLTETNLSEAGGDLGLLHAVLDIGEEIPIAGDPLFGSWITEATWVAENENLEDEKDDAEDEYDEAKEEYEEVVDLHEQFSQQGPSTLADQCALMSLFDYLTTMAGHDPTGVHNPNIVMVRDNVPDAGTDMMMHKLITNPKFNGFYSLTPAKLSALTPKVRLYFVFEKIRDRAGNVRNFVEAGATPQEVLIPFLTNIGDDLKGDALPLQLVHGIERFDYGTALRSSEQRGWGAGLQNFEWDLFGKTTFTADKDIKAKAKFYFASFDEFLRTRYLPLHIPFEAISGGTTAAAGSEYSLDIDEVAFKYSDLASYDGSFLENLGYTLKADVGWEWNLELNDHLRIKHGFTDGELEAVENSSHTLILRKTTHKLDIKEDGSVELECEYIANSSGLLSHDKLSNILLSEQLINLNADNKKMRAAIAKCPAGDAQSGAYNDLNKAYKALKESMVEAQLLRIISLLNGESPGAKHSKGSVTTWDTSTDEGGGSVKFTNRLEKDYVGVNRMRDGSGGSSTIINPYQNDVKIHSLGLPIEAWVEISQAGPPDSGFAKINSILEKYDPSDSDAPSQQLEAELRAEAMVIYQSTSPGGSQLDWAFMSDQEIEKAEADREEEFIEAYIEKNGPSAAQDQTAAFQAQIEIGQEGGEVTDPIRDQIAAAEEGDVDPESFSRDQEAAKNTAAMIGAAEINVAGGPASVVTTPTGNYLKFGAIAIFGDSDSFGGKDGANGQYLQKQIDRYEENAETYREAAKDLKYKRVYYCYFKDLLDAVFYIMKTNAVALGRNEHPSQPDYYLNKINKFRLVLGNIEIAYDDQSISSDAEVVDKYMIKNIGNVPISIALLRKFLINKIVKPKQSVYNFLEFTKDIIQELIVNTINDSKCWGKTVYQSPTHAALSSATPDLGKEPQYFSIHNTMVSAGTSAGIEVFDKLRYGRPSAEMSWSALESTNFLINLETFSADELPLLKQPTPRNPMSAASMYDYAIFYVPQIKEGRTGNFEEDVENGIQHYFVGSSAGIVKSIKFNKSDSKGLREARIEASGDSNESLHQMLDRYDATIELYGNAKIIPGSMLYIDPKGFSLAMGDPWDGPKAGSDYYKVASEEALDSDIGAPSPSWILGIGGYYLVTQITSKIQAGEFSTTLKAMWTDGGEMFMPPAAEDRDEGEPLGECADMAEETRIRQFRSESGDLQLEMAGGVGAFAAGETGLDETNDLLKSMASFALTRQNEGKKAEADAAAQQKEERESLTLGVIGETLDELMR